MCVVSLELAANELMSYALSSCSTANSSRAASCQQGAPHPGSLYTPTPTLFCLLTHFFFPSPPSLERGCRVCRRVDEERERCLLLLALSLMHEAQVEVLQRKEDGASVCAWVCECHIWWEHLLLTVGKTQTQKSKWFLDFLQPVLLYVMCVCVVCVCVCMNDATSS